MKIFSKPKLGKILDDQKLCLNDIFGVDNFQINASHPDEATIASGSIEIVFGRDNRDGNIGVMLTLKETTTNSSWQDGPFQWAKFLGEEERPKKRDRNGKIVASTSEQIVEELELIGRLVKEIFSDPSKTRDAINWLAGYREAYNARSAGDWD